MTLGRGKLTRRALIQRFGVLAFALTPVARAMGYVAGGSFMGAPRFVMFFKGGAFHPKSTQPASIDALSGTPIAPLPGTRMPWPARSTAWPRFHQWPPDTCTVPDSTSTRT